MPINTGVFERVTTEGVPSSQSVFSLNVGANRLGDRKDTQLSSPAQGLSLMTVPSSGSERRSKGVLLAIVTCGGQSDSSKGIISALWFCLALMGICLILGGGLPCENLIILESDEDILALVG